MVRLATELGYLDTIDRLEAEIKQLRIELALWKDRYEAERRDHEETIKHIDKQMNEWSA